MVVGIVMTIMSVVGLILPLMMIVVVLLLLIVVLVMLSMIMVVDAADDDGGTNIGTAIYDNVHVHGNPKPTCASI